MSSSKTLFYLCISFILGVFFESAFKIPQIFLWGIFILGFFLILLSIINKSFAWFFGFCILFLILGILRTQIVYFKIENDKLVKLNDFPKQITLIGTIINEPDIRENYQKLKVKIILSDQKINSVILVTTEKYPEFKYLDKVEITGKLQTPMESEDFSYKNYLMKEGIYSVMNFAKVEKIERDKISIFSYFFGKILDFKQKLRQNLQSNFLPPQGYIMQGIILGEKSTMPKELKNKLSIVGVSHIIAVSGTHVVILTTILMGILLFLNFSRNQAFYFSIIFISFYVVLVGLPASGVRAGIMACLVLLAQKIGRQTLNIRIIVLVATLMLLQNPFLLFYDIGFQLSFLAVLGIIMLEPILRHFLKFIFKNFFKKDLKEKFDNIIMILTVTISAQIFTLPIIVFNFGNISFVSPITNILILPIIPYLMFFGFLSAVVGIVFSGAGWILSVPCYFLLTYFLKIVDIFYQPWAYKTIENVHLVWLLIFYVLIVIIIKYLNKKFNSLIFV